MVDDLSNVHSDTSVVALGRPRRDTDASLNPPIVLSSTFIGETTPNEGERMYARVSNPTWEPLELAIGELEGSASPGLAYASGMAAISAVFSMLPSGAVVAVPSASYNGSIGLARQLDAEGKIKLREVDPTRPEQVEEALGGVQLLWLESPTNPLLDVLDLPRLIAAAKSHGALVAVDNTFSSPLRQRPLELGADIVVHSATKFIAGHSDLLMGLVVPQSAELRVTLHRHRTLTGAIPGPFEAWLALRGLRTLAVRLDRAEENAAELARRLSERPEISRVRYPGLPSDPSHQMATKLLDGFGAIVSIEFAPQGKSTGEERADSFIRSLRLVTPATSLGGVETLAERRRRQPSEPVEVPKSLVRLSVGIENIEDLWADIDQAITQ